MRVEEKRGYVWRREIISHGFDLLDVYGFDLGKNMKHEVHVLRKKKNNVLLKKFFLFLFLILNFFNLIFLKLFLFFY